MAEKLVSIIMPTYNRAHVIARAIKSVMKQTYQNWELLIIDDGSVDDTEQVVTAIHDSRICYVKLSENRGACHARNRGLDRAKGAYIAFLDSDNVWLKNYLEERIKVLESSSAKVGGVFGRFVLNRGRDKLIIPSEDFNEHTANAPANKKLIRQMLRDNVIDTNTIVLKKACVDKVNGFDERLRRLQDWEYFFRIIYYSGYRIIFRNDCLVKNYIQKDSISRKSNDRAYWETRTLFLEKYKSVYKEYDCFCESVAMLCLKTEPYLDEESLNLIVDKLSKEELSRVVTLLTEAQKGEISKELCALTERLNNLSMVRGREYTILMVLSKWLNMRQNGTDMGEVLDAKGYKAIAIYGYGHLGKLLYRELQYSESACNVVCVIDKFLASHEGNECLIVSPDSFSQKVDAVIVTAVSDFDLIKKQYERDIPYLSLKDLIEDVLNS